MSKRPVEGGGGGGPAAKRPAAAYDEAPDFLDDDDDVDVDDVFFDDAQLAGAPGAEAVGARQHWLRPRPPALDAASDSICAFPSALVTVVLLPVSVPTVCGPAKKLSLTRPACCAARLPAA